MSKCYNCGSEDLYKSEGVRAYGGYGPDLLPGLGGFWRGAKKFDVILCRTCGLTQFYAHEKARIFLPSSGKWKKI